MTGAVGRRIGLGHKVMLRGPFGGAYFRPDHEGRLVLVATNTGFAPIWSIAVAALRENPHRMMMIIAGGRELSSLYMGPALVRLAAFSNVTVVAACTTPQSTYPAVKFGRPTEFLPHLLPSDAVYVCGAPAMVEAVKAFAGQFGATCFADPFVPNEPAAAPRVAETKDGLLRRTKAWFVTPKRPSLRIQKMRERIEPGLPDAWVSKG